MPIKTVSHITIVYMSKKYTLLCIIMCYILLPFSVTASSNSRSNSSTLGMANETQRLVVTFQTAADNRGLTPEYIQSVSMYRVVKQYGRRLVLDVGYVFDLESERAEIEALFESVENVEHDYLLAVQTSSSSSSSSSYTEQEITHQTEMSPPFQWNLMDSEPFSIHAEGIWPFTNSTPDVVVAVLDSGIGMAARALFLNLIDGYDFISDAGISNDGDGRDPNATDPGDAGTACPASSWHGTKVASILAARHDNGLGVRGIAQNCTVMPIRVLGMCRMGYASDLVDGIVWAAGGEIKGAATNHNPVQVISISLSGEGVCPGYLQSAVNQAISLGSIIIAAAGNNDQDAAGYFPANCEGVIAVAASTRKGTIAPYSNWGPLISIAAPGGDSNDPIMTLSVSSFESGWQVAYGIGTSFSVPSVSAMLALKWNDFNLYSRTCQTNEKLKALNTSSANTIMDCFAQWVQTRRLFSTLLSEKTSNAVGIISIKIEDTAKYHHNDNTTIFLPNDNTTTTFWETFASWNSSTSNFMNISTNIQTYNKTLVHDTSYTCPYGVDDSSPSDRYGGDYLYSVICSNGRYVCKIIVDFDNIYIRKISFVCCDNFDYCEPNCMPSYNSKGYSSGKWSSCGLYTVGSSSSDSSANPRTTWTDLNSALFFNSLYDSLNQFHLGFLDVDRRTERFYVSAKVRPEVTLFDAPYSSCRGDERIVGFHGWYGDGLDQVKIYCRSPCKYGPGRYNKDGLDIICPVGTYNPRSGAYSCTACSPGYYCPSEGLSSGTACPAGTYNPNAGASSYSCTPCSSGYYCPNSGSSSQTACAAGTYNPSSGASSSCTPCSSGYYCPNSGSSSQTACAAGTYNPSSGASSCTPCSAGYYCFDSGLTKQSTCPVGGYNPSSGASVCTPCSSGYYCPNSASTSQTACAAGTYNPNSGASVCKTCSPGYYSPNSGTINSCTACSPGYYCPDSASTSQTACPAGTYNPSSGVSSCTPCSSGYYCPNSGSTSQTACAAGTYNPNSGASSCTPCSPGYYCPSSGLTSQTTCPTNMYNPNNGVSVCQSCASCNAGSYWLATCGGNNAGSCVACEVCNSGYYSQGCSGNSAGNCLQCTSCNSGYYPSTVCGGTSNNICAQCNPSYSGSQYNYVVNSCTYSCNQGYDKAAENSQCVACVQGKYKAASMAACTLCPDGTYQPDTNAINCIQNPNDSISTSDRSAFLCNAGYYKYTIPMSVTVSCRSCGLIPVCAAGNYLSGCGGTSSGSCSACTSCGSGTYLTGCGGMSAGSCSACTSCSSGTYMTGCGGTSAGVCTACASCTGSKYWSTACGGTSAGVCTACASCTGSNYWSTACGGTSAGVCTACTSCTGPNYWSTTCGGTLAGVCTACSTSCATGSYLLGCGGTSAGSCTACSTSCGSGSYLSGCSGTSAGSCSACTSCGSGTYMSGCSGTSAGSCSACTSCGSGTYLTGCGGTLAGTCIQCQVCGAGSYWTTTCGGSSAGSCVACGGCSNGFYRQGCSGNSAGNCLQCTSCNSGYYPSTVCGGTSNNICAQCNPSYSGSQYNYVVNSCTYSCNQGYDKATETSQCVACAQGKYRAASMAACTLCPDGTYQPDTNAINCIQNPNDSISTSDRSAFLCNAGYFKYTSALGYSDCTSCAAITPCAIGNYRSGCGGASMGSCAQCTTCGSGKYSTTSCSAFANTVCGTCSTCAVGLYISSACTSTADTVCTACPKGSYCNDGVNVRPCAAGTFSSAAQSYACSSCTAGTYMDSTGASACLPCTLGNYCPAACSLPQACNPGTTTVAVGASICTTCSALTVNAQFTTLCSWKCNVGYYIPAQASSTCAACSGSSACNAGYYRPLCTNGLADSETCSGQCINKPAQSFSFYAGPSTDNTNAGCPWGCNMGYYKNTTYQNCYACSTTCPLGYYASSACYSGSSTATNLMPTCVSCTTIPNAAFAGQGTTPNLATSCPFVCNSGFYKATSAATACTAWTSSCPTAGYYLAQGTPTTDAVCTQCSPFYSGTMYSYQPNTCTYYCIQGYDKAIDTAECKACVQGKFKNSSMTQCFPCSGNTYQPNTAGVDCQAVPLNSIPILSWTSFVCNAGYYSSTSLLGGTTCPICPQSLAGVLSVGWDAATNTKICDIISLSCNTGFYRNWTVPACLQCPLIPSNSIYGSLDLRSFCSTCKTVLPAADLIMECPFQCNAGFYADTTSNGYSCIACTSIVCATGTYLQLCTGGANSNTCLSCTYQLKISQMWTGRNPCEWQCRVGYYLNLSAACAPCDAGKYKDMDGNQTCTVCPKGTYGISPISCQGCAIGTYSPLTGMAQCLDCENGTIAPSLNSSQCVRCQNATSPGTRGTSCAPCPVLLPYSINGINCSLPPPPCPPGFFFSAFVNAACCVLCPIGTYCTGNLTMPVLCPVNLSFTVQPATSVDSCLTSNLMDYQLWRNGCA